MAYELSSGALSGVRKMSGSGTSARHRLLISDGLYVNSYAILASSLNDKLENGELEEFAVVQVIRYISSSVPSGNETKRQVMILLDLNVVAAGAEVGQRIGNPQPMSVDSQVPVAAVAPAAGRSRAHAHLPAASRPPVTPGGIPSWVAARIPPPLGRQLGELGTQTSEVNATLNPQPIPSLTPYTNNWCIKGRVTSKSSVRSWTTAGRTGKLFSFDVVDRFGEIRITAFKDQCDKFFDVIEVGNVYIISRGVVKPANLQFSSLKNDFEVALNVHSQVTPVLEDSSDIPVATFNFEPLSAVSRKNAHDRVDIIGICRNVGELVTFTARSSKEITKRELTVVDRSMVSVTVTLWGTEAGGFSGDGEPVIVVKGGVINEFRSAKSVSAQNSSTILINPDIPEAHQVRGWYDNEGKTMDFKNTSQRSAGPVDGKCVLLAEIKDIGNDAFFNCKGDVVIIKSDNAMYMACPSGNCNKKVIDLNNGLYSCSKCKQEFHEYSPRFLLSMGIADYSAYHWVTCFNDVAETILGRTAAELNDLKDSDPEAYVRALEDATFTTHTFRLRAQMQTYNDEQRLRITVLSAKPLDHVAYAKDLLKEMEDLYGKPAEQ